MNAARITRASRSTRTAAALLSIGVAGLVLAWAMPRGPMTSGQSLAALGLGAGVGVLSGWLMASRWAALLAPAVFGAAFEIARIGTVGPTVDAIRLDGFYGILALVVGRGFDLLVIVLPDGRGCVLGSGPRTQGAAPRRGPRGWRAP